MVVFDAGLVVVVMGGELNGGELAHGAPISEGELCGNGNVVLKLFELGSTVAFPEVPVAVECGTDVDMAVLVVSALGKMKVELQFDVDGIGGKEVVVVVCVREYVEKVKALSPLLRALGQRAVSGVSDLWQKLLRLAQCM